MKNISSFISVEELCARWQQSYRDILYKIKKEELKWDTDDTIAYDTIDDQAKVVYKKEYDLMEMYGHDSVYADKFNECVSNLTKEREQTTAKMTIESLKSGVYFFKIKEIEKYEKNPGFKLIQKKKKKKRQRKIQIKIDTSFTFLDPKNKHVSKELIIAVKAWEALFGIDGTYDEWSAAKKQIIDWIEENYATLNLKPNMIECIATVVNPNKRGGATRTKSK
jgi:hypothetical protein